MAEEIDLESMLNQLVEEFGTAESEKVTENSYEYRNRTKNMMDTIDYIEGKQNKVKRLYVKRKYGYD